MINLNFGLWWSGAKLSYLRYLTFKSLRHFHPHSRIQLFISNKFCNNDTMGVSQEFTVPNSIEKDYLSNLSTLDVEIAQMDKFGKYAPNHQSDIFRWWFLREFGGIYLDTDQIILKSFKSLPLKDNDFMYSAYDVKSPYAFDGKFSPVGVLGADQRSKALKSIAVKVLDYYKPDDYNCLGPLMFADMLKKLDLDRSFNAPSEYFYPAAICDKMEAVYSGDMELPRDSYSLHWFGGYNASQRFNRAYTEGFAQESNDTISKILRRNKII